MRSVILLILFGKEGELMMAMLWAQKIMLEILIESGMEELIQEEE